MQLKLFNWTLSLGTFSLFCLQNYYQFDNSLSEKKPQKVAQKFLNKDEKIQKILREEFINFKIKNQVAISQNHHNIYQQFNDYIEQEIVHKYHDLFPAAINNITTSHNDIKEAFEVHWWGFKWYIKWLSVHQAGMGKMDNRGYFSYGDMHKSLTALLKNWAWKGVADAISKYGVLIFDQIVGCLWNRQTPGLLNGGVVVRMLWVPPVMTGCWDQ